MSKTWMIALALVLAPLVSAQAVTDKIVEPKHIRGDRGQTVVDAVKTIVGGDRLVVSYEPSLNLFMLRGSPEVIQLAEKLIARLDQPEASLKTRDTVRQVSLNVFVLEGSAEGTPGNPIPATIESAVTQLRSLFHYKNYSVIDTVPLVTRVNSGASSNGFWRPSGPPNETVTNYNVDFGKALFDEQTQVLTVSSFRFFLTVPGASPSNDRYRTTGINSELTIRQNQKLVVGKITGTKPDSSLFLIVTARVE